MPDGVCVPAIARRDLPWPEWPAQVAPVIYMVTSAYVAARLPADGLPVAALRPKCSSLLGNRVVVSAEGGSAALAKALGGWSVRWPTSDLADVEPVRAVLGERLAKAIVYETMMPPDLHARLREVCKPGYGLYVASPSAVSNVLAEPLDPPARVVALGRTTVERYEALRPDGFPKATLVRDETAALEAMI